MEYKGKVYAKINGRYIECTETVEGLEAKIKKLSEHIELYRECFEKFIPIGKWDEATKFLSISNIGLAEALARRGI